MMRIAGVVAARSILVLCALFCGSATLLRAAPAPAGAGGKEKKEDPKKEDPKKEKAKKKKSALHPITFTYLVADGVGTMGSTAFRVEGKESPTIYIEAFPKRAACKSDPEKITKADLIIQCAHGHMTHYDADVCAGVARKTGALVLGNAALKADMRKRGIPEKKIIELSPKPGKKVSKKIESLGVTVTAYGMEHTMMSGVAVDTFLVEMPNGIRWYHGTCSSGPVTIKRMKQFPELSKPDLMLMDCDVDFAALKAHFKPGALIRTHDFKSGVRPAPATLYTDYPKGEKMLKHGDSHVVKPAKKTKEEKKKKKKKNEKPDTKGK